MLLILITFVIESVVIICSFGLIIIVMDGSYVVSNKLIDKI
jgi:hypothetical protein